MIEAQSRGWTIVLVGKDKWIYEDNNEPFVNNPIKPRPCKKCNRLPTKEGYDACMGHIEGATSVCCGHGVSRPILMMEEDETVY